MAIQPASGSGFYSAFARMEGWGVFDILLPFLLVFAIVFAVLEKIKMFGDDKKNIHVVIALILGVMFIGPHFIAGIAGTNRDPVQIIQNAIPSVSIMAIAVVCAFIILGLWSKGEIEFSESPILSTVIIFLTLGVILYIFGKSAGWWRSSVGWPGFLANPETRALILIFAVFAVVILFVVGGGKPKEPKGKDFQDFMKSMGSVIGKRK